MFPMYKSGKGKILSVHSHTFLFLKTTAKGFFGNLHFFKCFMISVLKLIFLSVSFSRYESTDRFKSGQPGR